MNRVVLIADADTETRELHKRFLSTAGFGVLTARNGLECLQRLRDWAPVPLVLDLDLLWGGGEGVLAWLRDSGKPPNAPSILVTGHASPRELARRAQLPEIQCVRKPVPLVRLLQSGACACASHDV